MNADEDFWAGAIADHDRPVFLSLLSLGLTPDRARDVAQATWTTLLEKHAAGQLTDIQLPGLAITQARFLALNELRRDQSEKRALSLVSRDEHDGGSTLGAAIGRDELRVALAALARLSPQARRVFRLVYGHPPHTHAETAREVGLSLQRVRQILCETRKQLRTAVDEGRSA